MWSIRKVQRYCISINSYSSTYSISCTVRWQGTWKLVHGCGESCRPEPKARGTWKLVHGCGESCRPEAKAMGAWKLVHGCGESCRPEAKARGDMIRHSREQVSKSPAT